ncbi:bifunctional succinyldiaminopimelate transaminase/glutamate-prephenate aminotransferase [Brooklawnia propionicigenes]|uniref:Aminotransferase n=1 Tax=Brooklawnia propionicigenes TaxID=3041175 RepID=A0AAN0MFF2_9ACTN|nr:succinyldiaminopimelate transaminase [Brooklawnia sp. SH051]BEH01364.1 bifunctional succinyldiaminopimelate transaminase/glutamate-prephenate aminotransferase [Brooklawnia sp. SH051]
MVSRWTRVSAKLPVFPWDTLAEAKATAAAHPGGLVDLSVGTPVDPTPEIVREALAGASDAHGYPTTWGTAALRAAIIDYLTVRWQAEGLDDPNVLPVIGTKEIVAWLPTQMGLGPDDLVVIPATAYPTYDVGARLAGCRLQLCDDPDEIDGRASLIWINYPANPSGAVASDDLLHRWITTAREHGAVLASDECYGEFGWDAEPASVVRPDLCEGSLDNILLVNSLSKRSNMAGYRAGYLAGDAGLITELLEVRKHSGMMVPTPIQAAMVAALGDQDHVEVQRERYGRRRGLLKQALLAAGFRIDHSQGSIYLWATRGENCRTTIDWLAQRGILAAPGDFYGDDEHVRVALTALDERVQAAAERLLA